MKRKCLLIVITILTLGLFSGCRSEPAPISDPVELELRVDALLTDSNFRGAALIVRDGETILRRHPVCLMKNLS